jgi:DNA-binding transcriptional MerR regulator
MEKSPDAFRTISEVADHLDTPAHVLRFWESRFPQIKPVKRAGGRRYYRPADVALLAGIKRLLHDEGMTIRGVQKVLREQGIRHVAGLAADADQVAEVFAVDEALLVDLQPAADALPETAEILPFEPAPRERDAAPAAPLAAAAPEAPPPAGLEAETVAEAPFVAVDDDGPTRSEGRWDAVAAHIEQLRNRNRGGLAPDAPAAPPAEIAPREAPPAAADLWSAAGTAPDPAPSAAGPSEPAGDPLSDPAAEALVEVDLRPIPPLAARLRRLPPGTPLARIDDIAALRARLAILREAMAESARGRSR